MDTTSTNAPDTSSEEPPTVTPLVCGQPCGTPSTSDDANTNEPNESEKTNVSN